MSFKRKEGKKRRKALILLEKLQNRTDIKWYKRRRFMSVKLPDYVGIILQLAKNIDVTNDIVLL